MDVLIPIEQGICTDYLIIRGEFTKITLCIYGEILAKSDIEIAAPLYNKNVELSNLREYQEV